MSVGLILFAILGLLVVHMTSPRFRKRAISAARFFTQLPPPDDPQRRFEVGNPLRSVSLYPQLLVLALLLLALLPLTRACRTSDELGLWVLVDTSHSMSTRQSGGLRIDLAREEALRFLERAQDEADSPCLRLSSFDMVVREHQPPTHNVGSFRRNLVGLAGRQLGTDLGALRLQISQPPGPDLECQITHQVIISDLPAPDWVGEHSRVIWRDIGLPADNIGFSDVRADRDLFTGEVYRLTIEATAWGEPPTGVSLAVRNPQGTSENQAVDWPSLGAWRYTANRPSTGLYGFTLSPGGAFPGDDQAVAEIAGGGTTRVDWQLRDRSLPDQLGWIQDHSEPLLRVVALGKDGGSGPVLMVGNHYGGGPPGEVTRFEEGQPLLAGLNLDVAESLRIRGFTPPEGFLPILGGRDGTWVARRGEPPGVCLPGLPGPGSKGRRDFSTTVFFNALRWLLATSKPPPLYTLTDPGHPEPEGSRIALHPGEGRSDHSPASLGDIGDIRAGAVEGEVEQPLWPWLLVLVAMAFALEQGLAGFLGEQWR